jgi:SagB-type dehydrogenase family enzyme
VSVEQALAKRRSVRSFAGTPLDLSDISQLLWAAQGISDVKGYRTAPSAGALYPLELKLIAGRVDKLDPAIYSYRIREHALQKAVGGDQRAKVGQAALKQGALEKAPATLLFCAVYGRMTAKYGERGIRYVDMEAGHAAQNVCLQAVALGLGTVVIGAFRDAEVMQIAGLAADEQPLYLVPVGH